MNKLLQFTSSLRNQKQQVQQLAPAIDPKKITFSGTSISDDDLNGHNNDEDVIDTKITKNNSNNSSSNHHQSSSVYSESYHGQVLEKDDIDGDKLDSSWHVGKLKFRKHIDDSYRAGEKAAGSDGRYQDDYVVEDTRKQYRKR